ncbi:MAG: hypothetical protein ACI9JE_001491, partial [Candidatus Krumholzibacteriia bacterium]
PRMLELGELRKHGGDVFNGHESKPIKNFAMYV